MSKLTQFLPYNYRLFDMMFIYLRLVLGRRLEPKCRSGLDQLRAKWGVDASLPTLISQDRKVLPEPTRAFPGNHNHSAHQEKNAVLHVSHNVLSFISESFVSYILKYFALYRSYKRYVMNNS